MEHLPHSFGGLMKAKGCKTSLELAVMYAEGLEFCCDELRGLVEANLTWHGILSGVMYIKWRDR